MRTEQSKSNKVIIFDWDDTICPSSFVDQWKIDNFKDLPLHFQNLFNHLGKCAEKCLAAASKYGEVIIITNSDDGWVNFSAERFVPNLLPIIPKYRIVSARTRYERFYPGQPLCWKAAAFAHEVNEIYSSDEHMDDEDCDNRMDRGVSDLMNQSCDSLESMVSTDDSSEGSISSAEAKSCTSRMFSRSSSSVKKSVTKKNRREVISFGDSMEERTAVKIVSGQLTAVPKSVMFISSPSPVQLIGQLNMLAGHMKFVCEHSSSLDLEISPHQAQKCAEAYIQKNKSLASVASEQVGGNSGGVGYFPRIRRTGSSSSDAVAVTTASHHARVD